MEERLFPLKNLYIFNPILKKQLFVFFENKHCILLKTIVKSNCEMIHNILLIKPGAHEYFFNYTCEKLHNIK